MFVLDLAAILYYINICFYSSHGHVFIFHNALTASMSLDIPCISTKSCGIDVAEYSGKSRALVQRDMSPPLLQLPATTCNYLQTCRHVLPATTYRPADKSRPLLQLPATTCNYLRMGVNKATEQSDRAHPKPSTPDTKQTKQNTPLF